MRVLRLGVVGDDVLRWKYFLIGQGFTLDEASVTFENATDVATRDFQTRHSITADGVVGPVTYGIAMQNGFDPTQDVPEEKNGAAWPPPPPFKPLVSTAERQAVFGTFLYEPMPTPNSPEAIRILDGWAQKNIVKVPCKQLVGKAGPDGSIWMHALARDKFLALWDRWEQEGLLPLVKSWAGMYVPRFVRGSRSFLSNHAFGTAFDINAPWNALGARPALVQSTGSVRELVPIANELGWFWGGHFPGRPDGMHFELATLD